MDAERFLVSIEDAKLRGAYVARPPVGCRSVSGPSGGSGRRQRCAEHAQGLGLSAKRARKAHQILSQILASAVGGGRLPRNVAEGIKLPKVQRREMYFLTAAQEVAGHLEWGGVKTHEACTVRLPRSLAEELGAYLAGRLNGREDLVFTAPCGGPLRESKFVPE